jgi:hypothetical protein
MRATITQTRETGHALRNKSGRSIVYVESNLNDIADKFAMANGIYELPFKSKTWNKVCRQVNKTLSTELKKLFPEALNITFSAKAGCKCGCSPGYIMKHEPNQRGKNFWVTIEASELESNVVSAGINSSLNRYSLQEEIENHKSKRSCAAV